MASSTTSSVYINVVEDVINKVREEFVGDSGPGEAVLAQLQATWEMKLIQAGAVLGPIERSSAPKPAPGGPITPVHDLNVPYEGPEEYETPTAEMLFPPTPLQTPIPTPLPGTADNSMYNIPTGQSDYSENNDLKSGRPSPYMQAPSPWMTQRPGLDVNVAYVEGREEVDRGTAQPATQDFLATNSGKRKRDDLPAQYQQQGGYIPQQDGAGDTASDFFEMEILLDKTSSGSYNKKSANADKMVVQQGVSSSIIPQVDGPIPDPYDDTVATPNIYNYQSVVNEDYNVVNTPAPEPPAATPAPPQNDIGVDDDEEEPLNENDDDDDDLDDVDQGEELNTQHLVLAQFEKVTRAKSRWKCILKDGIMHINSKDVLFNKANGEFEF